MATVTSYTAARIKQIEDSTIVGGHIDSNGNLILERRDGQYVLGGHVAGTPGKDGVDGAPGVIDKEILDRIEDKIEDNSQEIDKFGVVPKAPTNLIVLANTAGYNAEGSSVVTRIYFMWDVVVSSVDNQPINIAEYELWYADDDGVLIPYRRVPDTEIIVEGWEPEKLKYVAVRARAVGSTVWSDLSARISITPVLPAQVNVPPTAPTLVSDGGFVFPSWNGRLTDVDLPIEFYQLITEHSITGSDVWKESGVPATRSGVTANIRGKVGQSISVRFYWVDALGRKSPLSEVSQITVVGIQKLDLASEVSQAIANAEQAAADALESVMNTVKSIVVEYSVSSSETIAPNSGWSTSSPTRSPGTFIWTRTVITHIDETVETSAPAVMTGNSGATGSSGVGMVSTATTYQVGSSATVAPTGTWLSSPEATTPGKYLWTRTVISWSDNSTSTAYSVAAHGASGTSGKGISNTSITYQKSTNGTTAPTGTWSPTVPAMNPGDYIWTRTVLTYTDASTDTSYSVGRSGINGADGLPGDDGVDGQTTYLHTAYANGADGVADFSVSDPTNRAYLGTYTDFNIADSTNPASYKWVKILGNDGKGISSSSVHYQVSSSGTVVPTGSWLTTIPTATAGQYIWTRTTISFTDGASQVSYSTALQGVKGDPGNTGTGVSSVTPYYLMVGAGTAAPSKPTTNPPGGSWTLTEPGYTSSTELYRTELVVYTNGTFAYTNVSKVSSYTASSLANNKADALQLRGNNLVTNGNALLGNNTNFSEWDLEMGDQPPGTGGAFYPRTSGATSRLLDEYISVDPSKKYLMSVKAKQVNPGVTSRFYLGVVPYDVDRQIIAPSMYMEQTGTRTTLAEPLVAGQTTIQLTSSANWSNAAGTNTHLRTIVIWNHVDGKGKVWPAGTYSRTYRINAYADGGISGNTITLSSPWVGATIPAGTAISNGSSGGSYMYATGISNALVPTDGTWADYVATAPISGIHTVLSASATTKWPIATAFAKMIVLANYGTSGGTSKQLFTGFSFSDVDAAAQEASNAVTVANLADAKAKGMVKASATDPGHQEGRIWLVLNGAGQLIGMKTSNGSAWSSYLIMADQILVPSSVGMVSIANGAVTASKMYIGDFTNLTAGSDFEDDSTNPWNLVPPFTISTEKAFSGSRSLKISAIPAGGPGSIVMNMSNNFTEAQPGERYRIEITVQKTADWNGASGNSKLRFSRRDTGAYLYGLAFSADRIATAGEWTTLVGEVSIPQGCNGMVISMVTDGTAGSVWIDNIIVRKMYGGELLVNGTIKADKLNSTEIWANEAWLDVLRTGVIETDMVSPRFGDTLNLTANGAINSIIEWQDEMSTSVAETDDTANKADAAASSAANAAANAASDAKKANSAASAVDKAQKTTQGQVDTLRTWFRVDAEGAHIGQSGSPFQTHMKPDRFEITDNKRVTTYWTAGKMVVPLAEVTTVELSNHKFDIYGTGTVIRAIGV